MDLMPENNGNIDLNDNTEVRRQKKILEEAISNPENIFPEAAELHGKMAQSLKNLVEVTDRMYTKDQNGNYPKLDQAAQKEMVDAYKGAIESVDEYQKRVKMFAEASVSYDKARSRFGKTIYNFLDKVGDVLSKDFRVLLAATRQGIKTLPDVIRYSRTSIVDLGDQNTAKVGANMSSRIRLKVPGVDGSMVEGYFTPSSGKLAGYKAEERQAFEKLVKRANEKVNVSPETLHAMDERIRAYMRSKNYRLPQVRELCSQAYLGRTIGTVYMPPDQVMLNYIRIGENVEGEIFLHTPKEPISEKLFEGTGLGQMLGDYLMEVVNIRNKYGILQDAVQMDSTENLEQRNSAMADIAQLLGMNGLIAHSESMTIRLGDQLVSGTFMENAKGEDIKLSNMGTAFANPKATISVEHPHLKEQLADLQILDFICGNIDRHNGNMLYQFDKTDPEHLVCTGIQGIDNDASFGKILNGNNKLPKIDQLGVISERTAAVVSQLTPAVLKTVLRNYNFTRPEIEAVIQRTKNLRDAIEDGKIKIVAKEEWKDLDTSGLNKGYYKNLREMAKGQPNRLTAELNKEVMANYKKNFHEVNNLGASIRQIRKLLEDADKNVWGGSSEFKNTKKAFTDLANGYVQAMKEPSAKKWTKVQKSLEKALENARAYKEMKLAKTNLNTKEKRRLHAIERFLEAGETRMHAIGMMRKSCMQYEQWEKWKGKSFDTIAGEMIGTMRENAEKYPKGSELRQKADKALISLRRLTETVKSNIGLDFESQAAIKADMAAVIDYDRDLMNRTELTYMYGSAGPSGHKTLQSAMDVVTFLNDVYTNEKIKAPTMTARVEKEMKDLRKQERQNSAKERGSENPVREDAKNSARLPGGR